MQHGLCWETTCYKLTWSQMLCPSVFCSWTSCSLGWWWVLSALQAAASLWGKDKDSGCTTVLVLLWTSPWSSSWFPHRPRWFLAVETSCGSYTCPQLRVAFPWGAQLRCSVLAAKAAAFEGAIQGWSCFPRWCGRVPGSFPGGRRWELWLSVRSHSSGSGRKRGGSKEIEQAFLCCRFVAEHRRRRRLALGIVRKRCKGS